MLQRAWFDVNTNCVIRRVLNINPYNESHFIPASTSASAMLIWAPLKANQPSFELLISKYWKTRNASGPTSFNSSEIRFGRAARIGGG